MGERAEGGQEECERKSGRASGLQLARVWLASERPTSVSRLARRESIVCAQAASWRQDLGPVANATTGFMSELASVAPMNGNEFSLPGGRAFV